MKCVCGGETRVVDCRPTAEGHIRRRRKCLICNKRFSTSELRNTDLDDLAAQVNRTTAIEAAITRMNNAIKSL